MRLEEALIESDMGAAKRPYYSLPVDAIVDKVIISIGDMDDVYVAHASTGVPVAYLDAEDIPSWKLQGREDWEPIMARPHESEEIEEPEEKKNGEVPDSGVSRPSDDTGAEGVD